MYSKPEVIFVISVFLFVFCCFSVPIILYATDGGSNRVRNLNLAELSDIHIAAYDCQLRQVANYYI